MKKLLFAGLLFLGLLAVGTPACNHQRAPICNTQDPDSTNEPSGIVIETAVTPSGSDNLPARCLYADK